MQMELNYKRKKKVSNTYINYLDISVDVLYDYMIHTNIYFILYLKFITFFIQQVHLIN